MNRQYSLADRKKINEIEKKCEESLNQILRSANEATEISKRTEEELEHQTNQIKHINKEAESIEENLKQSEQHLLGIKYWWRNLNSIFGFDSSEITKSDKEKETQKEKEKEIKNKPYAKQKLNLANHGSITTHGKNNQLYENNLEIKKSQKKECFQEKYEKDLNSLSVMLEELHSRALVMGNIINEQNKMLNEVNEKMESNINKIVDQQKMMNGIMKK